MKIAIDCRLWNEGGVGRYVRNLVWQLQKLDKKNQYTLFFCKAGLFRGAENFKVKITTAKWHSFSEQIKFFSELKASNYDLVHFPYFSHPVLYNQPFVITVHDLTINKFATGQATTRLVPVYYLKRLAYKLVLRHGLKRAQQIIVPSVAVKTEIEKYDTTLKNKVVVTYEGLGIELKQKKLKPVLLPFTNFLLYVGNFYPHKNVNLLLKALCGRNLNLVLVGPRDAFYQRLKVQVEKLKLKQRVVFRFGIENKQLAWLYSRAQALVLPSLFEGFGLPIIEAANFGCPLLLSDIPVFREIAPPGSQFFSPRSVLALADCLDNVSSRSKLKLENDYFRRFSFSSMAKTTLAVYQKQG